MTSIDGFLRRLVLVIALALLAVPGAGATLALACKENAMLVFDSSGSMSSIRNGLPKIVVAREAASEILPDVTRRRPTGLVTYGGNRGPTCGDVHLKVPPMVHSGEVILAELGAMQPNGQTPLSDAVMLAVQTLKGLGKPGIVVLVTDGLENCGYNACAMGRQLRAEAANIRVHVIGFHLHSSAESRVACLSGATGGTYTATYSLETLRDALKETLGCPKIS
ncbi:MAG: vWA domain-containing protein [Hyphomicrobiaceae bacterium]